MGVLLPTKIHGYSRKGLGENKSTEAPHGVLDGMKEQKRKEKLGKWVL